MRLDGDALVLLINGNAQPIEKPTNPRTCQGTAPGRLSNSAIATGVSHVKVNHALDQVGCGLGHAPAGTRGTKPSPLCVRASRALSRVLA